MPTISAFFTDVEFSSTEDELLGHFKNIITAQGIDYICYFVITPGGAEQDSPYFHVFGNFPEAWANYYFENNFVEIDPIIKFSRTALEPFHWFDLFETMRMTPEAKDYLKQLRAAGFEDGMTFPVFGARGQVAAFGFSKAQGTFDFSREQVRMIKHICLATHERYVELNKSKYKSTPTLSDRELEILQWVARGKSDGVIADILGISSHTVDTHMRRVYEKLDVSNRVSACVNAICQGFIVP